MATAIASTKECDADVTAGTNGGEGLAAALQQRQEPPVAQESPASDAGVCEDEVVEYAQPDTMYAWAIAGAAFCNLATTMGTLNSFGVYQEYYLNELYKDDSAVAIAWVATLISFCMFIGAIFTGQLTDKIGFRLTCFGGAIVCGVALILASFAHSVWQLALTQGIMLGLGASLIFSPSMSIVAQWHVRHRVLATGIAVSGGGVGGMVFAVAAQRMIGHLGYRWSLRVLGFIIAALSGSTSILYRRRISPPKGGSARLMATLCKDVRFLCIAAAVMFVNMGYFEPLLYVPTAALKAGGSAAAGSNIVLVFNAGTTLGRVLSGPIAGALGPLNANLASVALSFVLICIFLIAVKTIAGYFVFSVLFGAVSTLYLAINAHILASEFGAHSIATSVGLSMACCGIGVLIGNPSQGALYETFDRPHERFTAVSAWAASCFAAAALCYAALRYIVVRKRSISHISKI
ncbi:MFS general substrate transporter [Martensiomyces pterosporus]|nr:MFS general substrate transporter [Martensiomyces pterosporus]